jgi:hypothetical protein
MHSWADHICLDILGIEAKVFEKLIGLFTVALFAFSWLADNVS